MVEVVNMRTCDPPWGQPGDVRIDRASKWGNPFPITDTASRMMVLEMYKPYMEQKLEGEFDIAEIAGAKRLGCWCKPQACHGDFLKRKIDEYNGRKQARLF